MYKIGDVKIKNRLVLAPMAGVNDIAFRMICKRFGAGLIYTEMVNANALVRGNKATLRKLLFSEEEKPITMQIFGARKDLIEKAAKIVEKQGADIIDLNLGCPDKDVIRIGAGSALLKRPAKIKELIETMVKSVNIPVTAKIRLGIKDKKLGIKTAKIVEEAGASAVAVHARTAGQMYSGKADWDSIKMIKEELSIPVIGNGDVFCREDAKRMLKETKCDFVMIGRGAIGNPWIFKEANECLDGKKSSQVSAAERLNLFSEYLLLTKEKECFNLEIAKRHAMDFTKGLPYSAKLRNMMGKAKSLETIQKSVEEFKRNFSIS